MVIRAILRKAFAFETMDGAGAMVKRVFPTQYLMHFDPFVLLDEFFVKSPAGFPDHPHEGFEAITYMLEGGFHHQDNLGNDSIVLAGGLQKFTAGRGIVHAELPGTKGLNRGLQLWIRLPSKFRNVKPDYQQVEPSAIPEETWGSSHVRIIVGNKSPVKLHTEVVYLDVTVQPKNQFVYNLDPKFNVFLYVLNGHLSLDRSRVGRSEAALLTLGDTVKASIDEETRFVLIGGRPQKEPITLRGSFVY